ncbi:hypothetical protein ACHAXT_000492 [Thalassiosira profunda]
MRRLDRSLWAAESGARNLDVVVHCVTGSNNLVIEHESDDGIRHVPVKLLFEDLLVVLGVLVFSRR